MGTWDLKPFTKLTHTPIQRMKPINFVYSSVIGVIIHNILTLHGAPQLSFGGGGSTSTTDNTDDSDQKTISDASSQGSGQLQTDNKIFFGNNNNNLNNILLGAAVGAGESSQVRPSLMVLTTINATVMDPIGREDKFSCSKIKIKVKYKDDGDKKIFGLLR